MQLVPPASSSDDAEQGFKALPPFGLFRDDFDGLRHMRQRVRASILSCLRLWHIAEQGSDLDPDRLLRLARLLGWCRLSSELDIQALRSLTCWLKTFLDRCELLAKKEQAAKQPGFPAVERQIAHRSNDERQGLWLEVSKTIVAVLAGEHAQLLLVHLVHHLEQHTVHPTLPSPGSWLRSTLLSSPTRPQLSSTQTWWSGWFMR